MPPVKNRRVIQPSVVGVGELAVREDVAEEPAARLEPGRDPARAAPRSCACARASRPTRSDRSGAVAGRACSRPAVMTSTFGAPNDSMCSRCGARVRDGDDPRAGVALGEPQRERAPAATEVEHRHAVLDAGAGARQLEHRVLCLRERLDARGPEARRVLEARPEHEPEELGRNLVVLLVRLVDVACDRLRRERRDERLLAVEPALAPQARRARRADARPQQRLRHDAGGYDAVDDFGNHGMNGLVSRW